MTDPTVIALQVCFLGALGMFSLSAIVRFLRSKGSAPPIMPPPLPTGRVATWPYLALDLVWLGFIFLTFFSLGSSPPAPAADKTEVVISAQGLLQSISFQLMLAGMTLVVMGWRLRPVAWLGLRWPGWKWVFVIVPAGVAAMWRFSVFLEVAGFMKWMNSLGVEQFQDSVKLLQRSQDPLVLGLMAGSAVLVAPLCEEIVFRGYFYPAAKKFAGRWVAGACSALVFAAAHGSLVPLLPLFYFGCLLVIAYELTGSLWAPIAMHSGFNAVTVVAQAIARS
ncbi:MAG: type II CAAX endopeptidase family protein [Verrucomicrobia bacterium]|nr:type II CAAX endopeptidase family protein [Verrucomicrobiota bacterium]